MKTCKNCGEAKTLNEFYSHPKTKDRRDSSCKECKKKNVRDNRKKNIEHYREYDKVRFQEDPSRRERNKKYAETEAGKRSMNKSRKKWLYKNQDKRAAHVLLGNAVRDGRVIKPDTCQECGSGGRIHGHHEDYAKPLDVDWLCPTCHAKRHN